MSQNDAIKIVMIGPGGVGKTTLKKIFFEQENPTELLNNSLEPTYGVETSLYEMGKTIAIHDLAGQQIQEWLTDSRDNFANADIIICILDSRDSWQTHQDLVSKVYTIRNELASKSYLAILFHKIDLINSEQRELIEKNIKLAFRGWEMTVLLTSIDSFYFLNTFRSFLDFLQKGIAQIGSLKTQSIISKMMIISQFLDKRIINKDTIHTNLEFNKDIVNQGLSEITSEGLISVNQETNEIQLTQKGINIVEGFKSRITSRIQKETGLNYIQGFILSDAYGRSFFTYEFEPDFFIHLARFEGSSDPGLISMFVSAIKDFGKTIDETGFTQINLIGQRIQIITLLHGPLYGMFFINGIELNRGVLHSLDLFLSQAYTSFAKEIDMFIKTGVLPNQSSVEFFYNEAIKKLNEVLYEFHLSNKKFSRETLLNLYKNLNSGLLSENELKDLKKIFTRFVITEYPDIMADLGQFS